MNDYLELMLSQLTSLKDSALATLGEESEIYLALLNSERVVKAQLRPVPNGMEREEYNNFLATQLPEVFADQDTDDVADNISDVVGVIIDDEGNAKDVGDVHASATAADELVAQYEEEMGAVEVDNTFTISYTRLDGQELTDADVHMIIDHPVSQPLKHLGNIQFLDILQGEEGAKKVRFAVLEDGTIKLNTLALGVASYRGTHVFPKLGAVKAIGTANFAV